MKVILFYATVFINIYLIKSDTDRYFLPEVNGKLAKGNFFYGYQLCKQNGLLLATPDTEEKNTALLKFMDDNSIDKAWISATDLAQEGSFVWMTNARPVTFTYWHDGQPDNAVNLEHCVEMIYVIELLKWNDVLCTNNLIIICEEVRIEVDRGLVK